MAYNPIAFPKMTMMMTTVIMMLVAGLASANIIFQFVQPNCSFAEGGKGCLRGQVCLRDDSCVPHTTLHSRDEGSTPPRVDGRCGMNYQGATCDPNGPYGPCCSEMGWCGKTPEHCLVSNGCQSGCDPVAQTTTAIPATPASPVSTGDPHSEPTIGPASTAPAGATPSGPVTTDGSCGASNGGTVCGNWHLGSCCSMYGFCGSSSAHCGEGCQSGPCQQAPVSPAPIAAPAPMNTNPGSFEVVGDSGVPAMHAGLLPNGRVVFLDKIENYTHLKLSNGYYAYSSEYDPATNEVVPLAYHTNAFCAGGSFMANGTFLSIGGNAPLTWLDPTVDDGFRAIRYLTRSASDPSFDGESWIEPGNLLSTARWYPSVQTMPDGTLFVASGSLNGLDPTNNSNNNPTYEILDVDGVSQGTSIPMQLFEKTQPYYMYAFIHLLSDGTLFVFVSKSSEIFNVSTNSTVKSFPDLAGDYRTYPNTGGSVLLPLSSVSNWSPDIIICGGGAYQDITSPTDPSCGRIRPMTDDTWEMDSMPEGRGMVEGTLLPDGTVLWVNGCNLGAQGFGLAQDPTLEVLIYDPEAAHGSRWTKGASTTIPRLYHSVALLLLDGTLMITGSNPNQMPITQADAQNPYITDFRVEIYTPPYLQGGNANRRPTEVELSTTTLIANAMTFSITFTAPPTAHNPTVALYHGGFVTHSLHMSHRMLFLDLDGWIPQTADQKLTATMPPNSSLAPPGPYVVYVVVDGVPSIGQFVMVSAG